MTRRADGLLAVEPLTVYDFHTTHLSNCPACRPDQFRWPARGNTLWPCSAERTLFQLVVEAGLCDSATIALALHLRTTAQKGSHHGQA